MAYLLQCWKTASISHSLSLAKSVSWQKLLCLRGKWGVTWQCISVVHCASDHADSWELPTSDRWSRERCCCHAPPQPVSFVSQEDERSYRLSHAAHVAHWLKSLSNVKRFSLQTEWRHLQIAHPAEHQLQQPLKHLHKCSVRRDGKN